MPSLVAFLIAGGIALLFNEEEVSLKKNEYILTKGAEL